MAHENNITDFYYDKDGKKVWYNEVGKINGRNNPSAHPVHLNPRYMQTFGTMDEAEKEAQSISKSYDEPVDKQMNEILIRAKPWEKEILARLMYGEASNQGEEGMTAVGNVVMNRLKSPTDWWGNSIESIISHPEQFSVFNDANSKNFKRMTNATEDDEVYRQALEIAEGLLTGNIEDNTEGSTHYYNPDDVLDEYGRKVAPPWVKSPLMTKIKKIGDHTFLMEA
tara:strand:- start:595 stop:1269 length:675 start_codon:yes stop_codon:yes gene_type:complete